MILPPWRDLWEIVKLGAVVKPGSAQGGQVILEEVAGLTLLDKDMGVHAELAHTMDKFCDPWRTMSG